MQHHLISSSTDTCLKEPICLTDSAKNLARVTFRLI